MTGFPILTWTLLKRAKTHIKGGDRTPTTVQSGYYRCRYSATEVQASVELSSDATCWLEVTFWKDLGDGTAQGEQPWIAHQSYRPGVYLVPDLYQPTRKYRGCIPEAFESPLWLKAPSICLSHRLRYSTQIPAWNGSIAKKRILMA